MFFYIARNVKKIGSGSAAAARNVAINWSGMIIFRYFLGFYCKENAVSVARKLILFIQLWRR